MTNSLKKLEKNLTLTRSSKISRDWFILTLEFIDLFLWSLVYCQVHPVGEFVLWYLISLKLKQVLILEFRGRGSLENCVLCIYQNNLRLLPSGAWKIYISMKSCSWVFEFETLWLVILTLVSYSIYIEYISSTFAANENVMCDINKQYRINVSKHIFSHFKF